MNFVEIVAGFNWVDVVLVWIILLTTYNGIRINFILGFFKTLGVVLAVYVSLHYFSRMSDFVLEHIPNFGVFFADLSCFIILAVLSYFFVVFLRIGFCRLVKVEATSLLDRWGGFILGFVRGLLIASMLIVFFNVSFIKYLQRSARRSYLASRLVYIDMDLYRFIFERAVSKFSPNDELNINIYDIVENELEERDEVN